MKKVSLWFVSACAVIALAACGGGGGEVVPPSGLDKTPPSLSVITPSPVTVTSPITIISNETLNGQFSVVVRNGQQAIAGVTTLGASADSLVWSPLAPLPYNVVLTVEVTASDVAGNVSAFTSTVTTASDPNPPAWWPPQTVVPMGVKVFGANQLPATCLTESDPCWREAIANGTVKFINTSAVMTGYNTRPVVFAYFKTASGLWSTSITYADNGSLLLPEIASGVIAEVDWVYGTPKGIIVHEKASGLCYEKIWYPPSTVPGTGSNVWSTFEPVACP